MKKDLIKKVVDTVCNTMFISAYGVEKVCVDSDRATKCGLAWSISKCFKYVELMRTGHKEDIVIAHTDYDNAVNIWTTVHENGKCIGYRYVTCVYTEKRNQIEVTAELCMNLGITEQTLKY